MRKALIVGIDNYTQCPLHGCCNDADFNHFSKNNTFSIISYFCISFNSAKIR